MQEGARDTRRIIQAALLHVLVLWAGLPAAAADLVVLEREDSPVGMSAAVSSGMSDAVKELRRHVMSTADTKGHPFAVVDKKLATLHVFDATGRWLGSAPVLIGSAAGDHTAPGVGDKAIKDVLPHERTTPAGRFVAETGRNARSEEVIWIDYDAGVSMHPVLTTNVSERRLERLQSATADDNRVSYGCVNVPTRFYHGIVLPQLRRPGAVVYVMPEVLRVEQVFPAIEMARIETRERVVSQGIATSDP